MMADTGQDAYRLPQTAAPERYEIRLEIDLAAGTFSGAETVEVVLREPVREIVLNAAELAIQEVAIAGDEGKRLPGSVVMEEATERARLGFPEALRPGPWKLSLRFTGSLNDKLRGFYRSTFMVPSGPTSGAGESGPSAVPERKVLAVTQFEATEARRAFPCWDEPAFKAVFQITLVVDNGLSAVSNTRVAEERPLPGGKKAVVFSPTIRMSTYLVAFVVGELEATDPTMVGKTPIRIWCVPGKRHLARFAQKIAAFSLRFFEEYYGLPYPGDKLDFIAIPDFAFGAMENLGAITFRETALLVDETAATHAEMERVADVVAHEIAHMWFGDLVTMAWWNGLWLNEAFATFMEVQAVDAWRPAWQRWTTFGVSRAAALVVDGLQSSRPVEFPVVAPKDADAMFDVLTYEKGGAVLRMFETYLGPAVFRDGVRRYLRAHQYGNAETSDLWASLGEASGQPIPSVMHGWIFRPGYPLVSVDAEDGGRRLRFSQQRFSYTQGAGDGTARWPVPVTFRVGVRGGAQDMRLLLSTDEASVELPDRPDWVVVNAGGHGFYRVRYGAKLLERLLAAPLEILAPIERFNLVNDVWAACLAGVAPITAYLDLTARFREETDRNVWTVLLASFASLNRVIDSALRPELEALVRDRLGPAVVRLGWMPGSGEGELQRQLRGDLLRAAGTLGNDGTIQAEARKLYEATLADPSAVDPNLLPALVAILAHVGGPADYEAFFGRFKAARTPQEEQRYLHSLAGFRDPGLLRRTLALCLSGEVRSQDAPFLVRGLLMSVEARQQVWRFVTDHWQAMERQFPQGGFRRMWEGVIGLATPALEAEVRQFFASNPISLGGKTLEQYLEQLQIAVALGRREAAALRAYFS